jgi:hypothetical protein
MLTTSRGLLAAADALIVNIAEAKSALKTILEKTLNIAIKSK